MTPRPVWSRSALAAVMLSMVFGAPAPDLAASDQRTTPSGIVLDRAGLAMVEDVVQKMRGKVPPEQLSMWLSWLTVGYGDLGDYARARRFGEEAVTSARAAGDLLFEGMALNSLGLAVQRTGDLATALQHYEAALKIYDRLSPATNPRAARERAVTLGNMGLFRGDLGQFDLAAGHFREAIGIYRRLLPTAPAHLVNQLKELLSIALLNLAHMTVEPGAAVPLLVEGRDLARESGDRIGEAVALNLIGMRRNESGAHKDAITAFQQSLDVRRALGDRSGEPTTLQNLGYAHWRLSQYAEAENAFRAALAVWDAPGAFSLPPPAALQARVNLAGVLEARKQPDAAATLYRETLGLLRTKLGTHTQFLSESEQVAFLDAVNHVFDSFFSFTVRHRDAARNVGELYDALLWRKGFVVLNVAARRARVESSGPEARQLLAAINEKRQRISALSRMRGNPELRREADALDTEVLALERDLQRRIQLEPAAGGRDWRGVQRALRPNEAAIEFARFRYRDAGRAQGDRYIALALRAGLPAPILIDLGEETGVRDALADYASLVGTESAPPSAAVGAAAFAQLWAPVQKHLGTASVVYVAPDGDLHSVAWHILPVPARGKRLIDTHDVRLLVSTGDLLRPPATPSRSRDAVLFGNPAFSLDLSATAASATAAAPVARPAARGGTRGTCTASWGPLTETAIEIKEIGALLEARGWKVQTFAGAEALEQRVKALDRPRLLHLATHGCFASESDESATGTTQVRPRTDPMLQSMLIFAGANRASSSATEDGTLTAYEASALRLDGTELVVLSACSTGLGAVRTGEGVFGLRRALQVAGAHSLLMSLWEVPDQPTQQLMRFFYQRWLAGADKYQALRDAQLALRKQNIASGNGDIPFEWGAFVVVGR